MGNGINGGGVANIGGGSGGAIDGLKRDGGRNVRNRDTSGGKGAPLRKELDRPVITEAPQIRTN